MQNAIVHMTNYMLRKNKWSNKDCSKRRSKRLYIVFSLNVLPIYPSNSSACLTRNVSAIKAIQLSQKNMVFQARNAGLYHNLVFFKIALKYMKISPLASVKTFSLICKWSCIHKLTTAFS